MCDLVGTLGACIKHTVCPASHWYRNQRWGGGGGASHTQTEEAAPGGDQKRLPNFEKVSEEEPPDSSFWISNSVGQPNQGIRLNVQRYGEWHTEEHLPKA